MQNINLQPKKKTGNDLDWLLGCGEMGALSACTYAFLETLRSSQAGYGIFYYIGNLRKATAELSTAWRAGISP